MFVIEIVQGRADILVIAYIPISDYF
jgi:hypothetical protein